VLISEPEIPPKAGVKLQQLVPYALEEHLADDLDELHFAIGRRNGDSPRVPVAVVARSLVDKWLTDLRSSGIEPDTMYADSDLLPVNPGQSVALLEEDVVVVRPPSGLPITLPSDALAEALELAQVDASANAGTGRGLILYTGAAEWHQHAPQVEAFRERFDGIKIQLLTNGPLALFAQQLPNATPVNILQGSYAPTTSRSVGLGAWRIAAMLLVCFVALHVVGRAAELSLLKRSEKKIDTSIKETVQQAMPGQPVGAAEARHQMEMRLAAVRGGAAGLLPALEALVQAKGSSPGTIVRSLNYHNNTVDLTIRAPDAASLDRMTQTLRNNGWQADLQGGNPMPDGASYEGRIQIRSNGT
jgi:general secretion pathway protein L